MTRPVEWSTLNRGDLVLGGDKQVWTFLGRDPNETVVMERHDDAGQRHEFQGIPRAPHANLIHTAGEAREAAVAVVQVRLGGATQAIKDEHDRWRAPVAFQHPGALMSHIYILHGTTIPDEVSTLTDVTALHEQLHTPERKTSASGYVDHVHDPQFYGEVSDEQAQ